MVFNFFKMKRSAHVKKHENGGITTAEAGPPHTTNQNTTSSNNRPYFYPNPLALHSPNRLHWTPMPQGKEEATRYISGDDSAEEDLSLTIGRADHLSKIVPDINTGGLGPTLRWLKTGGTDQQAVDELLAKQTRAEERLRELKKRRTGFMFMSDESLMVLPATSFKASIKLAAPQLLDNRGKPTTGTTSRRSSLALILEEAIAEQSAIVAAAEEYSPAGCEACQAGFEKCSACYSVNKTGCDGCRDGHCQARNMTKSSSTMRSCDPSVGFLARPDKRPASPGSNTPSRASISSSLVHKTRATTEASALWFNAEALASLTDEDDFEADDDVAEICVVRDIALVVKARVVNVRTAAKLLPRTLPVASRLAIPSADRPKFYSLPSSLARPDSPTLPPAFPAPLFLKRK
ncbi:unnamed protein product [Discula destructiva]